MKRNRWARWGGCALLTLATVALLAAVQLYIPGQSSAKELDLFVSPRLQQGLESVWEYGEGIYWLEPGGRGAAYLVLNGSDLQGMEERGNELWFSVTRREGQAGGLSVFKVRRGRAIDTLIVRENGRMSPFDCIICV